MVAARGIHFAYLAVCMVALLFTLTTVNAQTVCTTVDVDPPGGCLSIISPTLTVPISFGNTGSFSFEVPQSETVFIEDICFEVGIDHGNLGDLRLELSFTSVQEAEIDMEIFDEPEGQADMLGGSLLQFSRYPTDRDALAIGVADGSVSDGIGFFAGNLTKVLGNINAGTWTINVMDLNNNAVDGTLTNFNLYFNGGAEAACEQSQAPSSSPSASPSQAPSSSPTEQSPVATPNTWFLVGALTLAPFLAFVAGLLRPAVAAVELDH